MLITCMHYRRYSYSNVERTWTVISSTGTCAFFKGQPLCRYVIGATAPAVLVTLFHAHFQPYAPFHHQECGSSLRKGVLLIMAAFHSLHICRITSSMLATETMLGQVMSLTTCSTSSTGRWS